MTRRYSIQHVWKNPNHLCLYYDYSKQSPNFVLGYAQKSSFSRQSIGFLDGFWPLTICSCSKAFDFVPFWHGFCRMSLIFADFGANEVTNWIRRPCRVSERNEKGFENNVGTFHIPNLCSNTLRLWIIYLIEIVAQDLLKCDGNNGNDGMKWQRGNGTKLMVSVMALKWFYCCSSCRTSTSLSSELLELHYEPEKKEQTLPQRVTVDFDNSSLRPVNARTGLQRNGDRTPRLYRFFG